MPWRDTASPLLSSTYFHGSTAIDTLHVQPNATPGAAVFAGELFNSPEVTNVLLTLGDGAIFKFDGTTIASGGANTACWRCGLAGFCPSS